MFFGEVIYHKMFRMCQKKISDFSMLISLRKLPSIPSAMKKTIAGYKRVMFLYDQISVSMWGPF